MQIAIIGATGRQGGLIVQEALKRRHRVTAVVRNRAKVMFSSVSILEKDLFRLASDDLKGFDAVVDAFRAADGHEDEYVTTLKHLIEIFHDLPQVRLLVVGGAGSLYVNPEKRLRLLDAKDFPAARKPAEISMAKALDMLKESGVSWTYLSPSAVFDPEGLRTGKYITGDDVLLTDQNGESYVSYADCAVAMVDEIERKAHIRKRFTVASEKLN